MIFSFQLPNQNSTPQLKLLMKYLRKHKLYQTQNECERVPSHLFKILDELAVGHLKCFDLTFIKSEVLNDQNKLLIKQKNTNRDTERNYFSKKNRKKRKITKISTCN